MAKSKSKSKSSATSVHLFATTGRTHVGSHCPGILRYTAAYFSCIDAPNEVKSKAENLFSNRLGRKRGSRSEDESKDGIPLRTHFTAETPACQGHVIGSF